jgi:hypothetical protein
MIRTERGWIGHFILADRCLFRRNTLLEHGDISIVVSTVGLLKSLNGDGFETTSRGYYFETGIFHSDPEDTRYHDADISRQIYLNRPCMIPKIDADDLANDMHDETVAYLMERMEAGDEFPTD